MPLQSLPRYNSNPDKMFDIPQPGIGGLNLNDLEFEQEVNQTPYMLNMMYRNGAFSKRYGQELYFDAEFDNTVYATYFFDGDIFVHAGTKIYRVDPQTKEKTQITGATVSAVKGLFFGFAQELFYICNSNYYQYNNDDGWRAVEPYVPTVAFNTLPDGSRYDTDEDFNIIGTEFEITYFGDGETLVYKIPYGTGFINWSGTITVTVDDEVVSASNYTVSSSNKTITFASGHAPSEGRNNVSFRFTVKDSSFRTERNRIWSSKYWASFGGGNNNRIFLAGNGGSRVYYSWPFDATYFPVVNFIGLGNTEEDVTGLGTQYSNLMAFKPHEVYSIYSYTQTGVTNVILADGSVEQDPDYGLETFKALSVNNKIGCDCPNTIQLINNQLTWFSSIYGVCTLVSTNIVDERNVRVISRNIEHTNGFGVTGILDIELTKSGKNPIKDTVQSVDFDNKYFLVFPKRYADGVLVDYGMAYVWDYEIAPYYYYSSTRAQSANNLDWYLFDNFYVGSFIKVEKELLYISTNSNFSDNFIQLTHSFNDLDFNQDGEPDGINAYYMTPFLQFNAVEYLKNVKNIYVQCRGDTSSIIDMYYYTEESSSAEQESESIRIGEKIWNKFHYKNFQWLIVHWANTFRRKCSLKKIQMASFYFENVDTYDYDLNGEHISYKATENKPLGHYDTLSDLEASHPIANEADIYSVGDGFYFWHANGWKQIRCESVAGRDMSISHIGLQYSIVKTIK